MRFGGLCSGPSGMHSVIFSITSGVTLIEQAKARAAVHDAVADGDQGRAG